MPYKNIEKNRKCAREYYYKNRERVLAYQKNRLKEKYANDPEFRKKRLALEIN